MTSKEQYNIARKNLENKEGTLYSITEIGKFMNRSRASIYFYMKELEIEVVELDGFPPRYPSSLLREADAIKIMLKYANGELLVEWLIATGYKECTISFIKQHYL